MIRFALAAALVLAAACHSAPKQAEDAPAPRVSLAGGYTPANAEDADTKAAEKLATDEIYKREPQRSLVEKVTREVQVVAGLNYRFDVKMSGMNRYRVVVFKPLPGQGEMKIVQFEKLPAAN